MKIYPFVIFRFSDDEGSDEEGEGEEGDEYEYDEEEEDNDEDYEDEEDDEEEEDAESPSFFFGNNFQLGGTKTSSAQQESVGDLSSMIANFNVCSPFSFGLKVRYYFI